MDVISTEALRTELGNATNTLFLSSQVDPHSDEVCMELLGITEPQAGTVLSVIFTRSLTDRLCSWEQHIDPSATDAVFIDVGQTSPSQSERQLLDLFGSVDIETVRSLHDLTGLGTAITGQLEARNENRTAVCLQSLTALLQYVDADRVYRFLDALTTWLDSIDVVAHYHLDPDAHDEQTFDRLRPLFDAVVRPTDEGGFTVQSE